MLNVQADVKRALRWSKETTRRKIPRLTSMALNKAARKVNTVAKRESADAMGAKRSKVGKQFFITFARPQAGMMEAAVNVKTKKNLSLIDFKSVRQVSAGVRAKAWGKQTTYRTAFIATSRGGRQVFTRGYKTSGGKPDRLPIRKLWGPRVRFGFLQRKVQKVMKKTGKTEFRREFRRLIRGSFRAVR